MNADNSSFRFKLLLSVFAIVFTINVFLFMQIEKKDVLESVYFAVITVTTVGYGDVVPTDTITKISSILLIITGIISLALLSEMLIDRIVKVNLLKERTLPNLVLDSKGNIIIAGYGDLGRKTALILKDRFENIIILDKNKEAVELASNDGFDAYVANIMFPNVLERLNLKYAKALFLCLTEINDIIKTAIISRKIASNLHISARVIKHGNEQVTKFIGINRVYHYEKSISSMLNFALTQYKLIIYKLSEKITNKTYFSYVETIEGYPIKSYVSECYLLGEIHQNLRSFFDIKHKNIPEIADKQKTLLYAVPQSKTRELKERGVDAKFIEKKFSKVFIAGYNEYADDILHHLKFENAEIKIIAVTEEQVALAKKSGFEVLHRFNKDKSFIETLRENITDSDLIIGVNKDITHSLLLNLSLFKNLGIKPLMIQIAQFQHEVETLLSSGVAQVISPNDLMAQSFVLGFLKDSNLATSVIYKNAQGFEHNVKENDSFANKSVKHLYGQGYKIALWRPNNSNEIKYYPSKGTLRVKDTILVIKYFNIAT